MRSNAFRLATLIATLPFVVGAAPQANAAESLKLGVVMPLTGAQAPFGVASLHGVQAAVARINASGGIKALGGSNIELVFADAASDPTTAASATQRIISRDRVSAILCCFASSLTLAASEVAERNHVPLLGMSTTNLLTSRHFKYWFQITTLATNYGAAQLEQTLELGKAAGKTYKRVAVLYEDTAFGTSTAQGIAERAKALGVEVALYEAYPQGVTDVSPLIQKVKAANADVLFPVSYFSDAVLLIRGLRQNGVEMPIVGGAAGFVIPEFRQALGDLSEGVLAIDFSNYDNYGDLGVDYRRQYGQFMTHEAFEHAALAYVVANAAEAAGSVEPARIGEFLHKLEVTSYPVDRMPGGGVHFDPDGLNTRAHPIMVQWQKGELATVWPRSEAKTAAILQ